MLLIIFRWKIYFHLDMVSQRVAQGFVQGPVFYKKNFFGVLSKLFVWGNLFHSSLIQKLGQVFNLKLGHFASGQHKCITRRQPFLKFKSKPGFRPVNHFHDDAETKDICVVVVKKGTCLAATWGVTLGVTKFIKILLWFWSHFVEHLGRT